MGVEGDRDGRGEEVIEGGGRKKEERKIQIQVSCIKGNVRFTWWRT